MIKSLDQLVEQVRSLKKKHRLVVAWAHDNSTIKALDEAVKNCFIEAILLGKRTEIIKTCSSMSVDSNSFTILDIDNEIDASVKAVRMVKSGEADIIMKGLVTTDKFLKAVMDKEHGLMKPNAVISYVCAVQLPAYHKLLFITDPAVIPIPSLDQKVAMANYSIDMARRFGIKKPKIALIGASEKMSSQFESAIDYAVMSKMAERGQIKNCIMDGPLDLFLACNKESVAIKGVNTPVNGDADILLFPSLESSNPFYKGLVLFGGGEIAGLIMGTIKPVVLMSRSESEKSKFYCIALSCLMADIN
jgi:phosphate butyryltransferase